MVLFDYGSLTLDPLLCLPPFRSRPDLRPAFEDVYIRASDGLVARAVPGYNYGANWVICTERTLPCWIIN